MVVGCRYVLPNDVVVSHLVADTENIKCYATAGAHGKADEPYVAQRWTRGAEDGLSAACEDDVNGRPGVGGKSDGRVGVPETVGDNS